MKNYPLKPSEEKMLHARIEAAVKQLYILTGLEMPAAAPTPPFLVPLNQIIDAFPGAVTVSEVADLTYASAAQHLRDEIGHVVDVPDNPDQRLDGLLYAWFDGSILYAYTLVCAGGLVERRRFTVAHELGHLMLHVLLPEEASRPSVFVEGFITDEKKTPDKEENAPDESEDEKEESTEAFAHADAFTEAGAPALLPPLEVMEAEADAFAAALLMPAPVCHALAKANLSDFGDRRAILIRRLSVDFLVSRTAMQRRLKYLKLGA